MLPIMDLPANGRHTPGPEGRPRDSTGTEQCSLRTHCCVYPALWDARRRWGWGEEGSGRRPVLEAVLVTLSRLGQWSKRSGDSPLELGLPGPPQRCFSKLNGLTEYLQVFMFRFVFHFSFTVDIHIMLRYFQMYRIAVRHLYNLQSGRPPSLVPAWHHTQLSQYHWLCSLCLIKRQSPEMLPLARVPHCKLKGSRRQNNGTCFI